MFDQNEPVTLSEKSHVLNPRRESSRIEVK
jgi:hypothetical protein